jgi:tetratricopeptide (TPR) repeat protein
MSRRTQLFFGVALVVATFLAYQPVWRGGFGWDDDLHVTENPQISEPGGMKKIWFSREAPQYYPLVFTSFRLEYAIWGLNTAGYHCVNIGLHAISALVLWRVLRRLRISGAWLAAGIFALHPVNVESVAWISERKNALCMVFFLLSLLLYLRSRDAAKTALADSKNLAVPVFYSLSVLAFVFALLSKTAVALFPVVLLVLAWWQNGKLTRHDFLKAAPFFVAAVAFAVVTIWFEHQKTGGSAAIRNDGFWSHLASAGCAVWFYLYKAALPLNLIFVYPRWHINPANPLVYIPGLLLAILVVVLWQARKSWGRHSLFALAYFLLLLLPILGFMNIGYLHYAPVADHWQYFAIIAPISLAVAGISSELAGIPQLSRPLPRGVVVTAAIVALGVLTWQRSAAFADAETLWRTTLCQNPEASVAHNQLGLILDRQGRTDDAIAHYEAALAIEPAFPIAELNLAAALQTQGRSDEAMRHLQAVLRLRPDFPEAHANISNLLLKKGDVAAALEHSLAAVRLKSDWAEAHFDLANAYYLQNRIPEAALEYAEAIRLNPAYSEAHQNLGFLFEKSGNDRDAAAHYVEVVRLKPEFAAAYQRLAVVLARQNLFDDAIKAAEEGIRLSNLSGQSSLADQLRESVNRYRLGKP